MPPSGFLISWARLRISSLFASRLVERALLARPGASAARSRRSRRRRSLEPSIWLTVTCTGSGSPGRRALQQRLEPAGREGVAADRRDACRAAPAASANQSNGRRRATCCAATGRARSRTRSWRTRTRRRASTTATSVASRSRAVEARPPGSVAAPRGDASARSLRQAAAAASRSRAGARRCRSRLRAIAACISATRSRYFW